MIVLLSSENPSKEEALKSGLSELGIVDYSIIKVGVESNVSSKPIDYEIIRGCLNRNDNLKKYTLENNIEYDYLCSIEGGFEYSYGYPYVVTYVIFEDKLGNKSTGKALGLRISKKMMDYIKQGNSLNKIIEEITKVDKNKQKSGITGYLSNDILSRERVDKDAVISSLITMITKEERREIDKRIDLIKK